MLEKLRWESGPASIPNAEDILPLIQNAQRELEDCEKRIKDLESRRQSLRGHAKSPAAIRNIPALALSSVCSRWRRTGLSMPRIWSRISVECDSQEDIQTSGDEQLILSLNHFFTRSLPCSLDLTVHIEEDALVHVPPHETYPVLTSLAGHTRRWGSFTYCSEEYNLYALFPGPVTPKFPLLEDLEIIHLGPNRLPWFTDMAPNLKSLRLPGSVFPGAIQSDLQALFDASPNLTLLKIEEVYNSRWGQVPIPVTSSLLKTLCIWHSGNAYANYSSFKFFNLSSLQTLHLEPSHHFGSLHTSSWVNFDPFMAFLQRSSFSLTTLYIQSLALSDSNLVHLLIHVPTLLQLTLIDANVPTEYSPITWQLIESLHAYRASPLRQQALPIVPRLHSLTLNIGARTFEDGVVVDMVRSRGFRETPSLAGDLDRWTVCRNLQ
ncbi:hypothetical protein BT96DRAFT_936488 [Gymnopus androsaceus JB14]|uniref:F-box domain-containing protein n=1 Tax=Gymnopus androsaceus JB14 TaxID=1447944 RepID=A0A6A4HXN9_9AGAR|nr:hypothetical protein BT96DRAFT_936488 [Gymnopus androsaceus JB14]